MKLFSTLYVVLCFALCCSVLQCMSVKWYALCLSAFLRVDLMRLSSGPLNTATHCNTLQDIALHYCILQHNATQCNAMMRKTVLWLFESSLNMLVINPIYLSVLQRVTMCCRVDAMCHNLIVCGFLALQTLYTNPCVCVCRCLWVWMCGPTHMGIKF